MSIFSSVASQSETPYNHGKREKIFPDQAILIDS